MTTLTKIGIGVGAIAIAVSAIPALKGPYNRFTTVVSEKLNDEFVVDNYKVEYVKLHEKRTQIVQNLDKFAVEKRVVEKKLEYAKSKESLTKSALLKIGTSDLDAFNRAKNAYEIAKTEIHNLNAMSIAYSNAIVKLERSLAVVDSNMQKAKLNVDTLSSKKTLVDTVKSVNKTIENLNGIGENAELNVSIEKLDDDALRENIKLEALAEKTLPASATTEAEAKAYLNSLK